MTEPIIKNIGLGGINVHPGRRALDPDAVARLIEAIKVEGLVHPITVRPRTAGGCSISLRRRNRGPACVSTKRSSA